MEYIEVAKARTMPGLKLVLTAGIPGPWSEGIKKVLEYKKIPYIPVMQQNAQPNQDLVEWTGVRNAPVIVNETDAPLTRWYDMLMFAERMAPTPAIFPKDSAERALVFGIINELAGEWGFGWCRRLMAFRTMSASLPPDFQPDATQIQLAKDYGVSPQAWDAAPARSADILRMLSKRLHEQRAAGSPYLVGKQFTAADVYWTTFSAQLDPLAPDVNPMPDVVRAIFKCTDPVVLQAADPILVEHRNAMYASHIPLPLGF
jgi:glutathione S-transferase